MKTRDLPTDGASTTALILDKGEEAVERLQAFAAERRVQAARIAGIGAFSDADLAYFDRATRKYVTLPVRDQVEVVSLSGNIALHEGKPRIHVHAVLGFRNGATIGGHLMRGVVWPTLELFVTAYAGPLERRLDPESGLPLLND